MKKISVSIIILLMTLSIILLMIMPVLAKEDKDAIADIEEESVHYEEGSYKSGDESKDIEIEKGEGFDFKAPEISIKGKIDTKVMLKREIRVLENISDVKNILYEKEKVDMPDYYLKEDELNPQNIETKADKDFVGRAKVSVGSYNNILFDGVIGKTFDRDNGIVIRFMHNNYDNQRINNRDNDYNINKGSLYYNTKYDDISAIYFLKGRFDQYVNPFPVNIFGGSYNLNDYSVGVDLSAVIADIESDCYIQYTYFDEHRPGSMGIYKENRLKNIIKFEKDIEISKGSKIKALLDTVYDISDISTVIGNFNSAYNVDIFFKTIFYLEPVVIQGGIRFEAFGIEDPYFRLSPYLNANYDFTSWGGIYFEFDPEMTTIDRFVFLENPFTAVNTLAKPGKENLSFVTGININALNLFIDVFYGYKSIKDNLYIDETAQRGVFSYYNNDMDYYYAGISIDTLKIKNIQLSAEYKFTEVVDVNTLNATYMPKHTGTIRGTYEKKSFKFGIETQALSLFNATSLLESNGYIDLNLTGEWKVFDFFTVTGYINNILNNNSYLLYYYKEKGFNLGLGCILNF